MFRAFGALACGCLTTLAVAATATAAPTAAPPGQAAKLEKAVTLDGMLEHERAFQAIADANGGNRAAGLPGYRASVDYVASRLRAAGYDPVIQPFQFDFFRQTGPSTLARVSPSPRTYVEDTDYSLLQYSGAGDVTARLQEVADNQFPPGPTPSSSNAGCEPADFAGFTPGNIALIQRGSCPFAQKVDNAKAAGASAVIIFNEGQPGRTGPIAGTLGAPVTLPVVGASFAVGQELHDLLASGPVTMRVVTQTESDTRTAWNVLADTPGGDPSKTVVVGSHLDSVIEGPGINDNGSGSAFNLELAEAFASTHANPRNRVRFAFWGAEEEGLLGSTYYVENLSEAERAQIALNLNFDMIASPNFVRFVYDGDGSDTGTAGPEGSGQIEQVFLDYFGRRGLATDPTAFDGRSDYGPFIDVGIPAGGLFTGAEGIKTPEQAARYGGTAGAPFDPCYHQACDTLANLNPTAFDQMADGAAFTTATFAWSKVPVTQTTSRPGKRGRGFDRKGPKLVR